MHKQTLKSLKVGLQKSYFLGLTSKAFQAHPYRFSAKEIYVISPIKLKLGQALIIQLALGDHLLKNIPARVVSLKASATEYNYGVVFTLGHLPKSTTKNIKLILHKLEADTNPQPVAA